MWEEFDRTRPLNDLEFTEDEPVVILGEPETPYLTSED
jgi:hypothetical protein